MRISTKKLEIFLRISPYSVNDFQINETVNLEIVIRYTPQDWFEIGLMISATTFIGCIGYLFYNWRREKGNHGQESFTAILKYLNTHKYVMPNITLSLPDDIYKKMKKYREIRWSEVVRKAIVDYIGKLEESIVETTTKELLDSLGDDFKKSLDELELEKAIKSYEKMRDAEWKRISMTQVN